MKISLNLSSGENWQKTTHACSILIRAGTPFSFKPGYQTASGQDYLEVSCTREEGRVFLHILNREYGQK
jgi:hypothetical protein